MKEETLKEFLEFHRCLNLVTKTLRDLGITTIRADGAIVTLLPPSLASEQLDRVQQKAAKTARGRGNLPKGTVTQDTEVTLELIAKYKPRPGHRRDRTWDELADILREGMSGDYYRKIWTRVHGRWKKRP